MDKLIFVFAALFVAAVYAAPDNFLASLKSFNHFKRAEALLKPLRAVNEQKKNVDEIELLMLALDQDNDKMLNIDELKVLLVMGGAPANQLDQYAAVLMMFDMDKNGKLDLKELKALVELGNL